MLLTVVVILLVIALLYGGLGYGTYGAVGLSPAAILLIVLLVLLFSGRL